MAFFDIYGTSTANDGLENWTVPASMAIDNYYIRITSTVNPDVMTIRITILLLPILR